MLACIGITIYCVLNIPRVHWQEFKNAIPHGEILIIIDVPKRAMQFVEHLIHRRHPEALAGGVCWKI